jgi:hypothetical protein
MSKEDAALYLAGLLIVVKIFYSSVWDAIMEKFQAIFSADYVGGVFLTAGLIAFGFQIYFAFVTGGASLLLAPIAWAFDTVVFAGFGIAVSMFVASVHGFFQGLYNGWKNYRAVKALGEMFAGTQEKEDNYPRTRSGRARDWSGLHARAAAEDAAEAAEAAAAQPRPAMSF